MKQQIEIAIKPDDILSDGILKTTAANQLKISQDQISAVIPVKRSIDARSKKLSLEFLLMFILTRNLLNKVE